MELIREILQNLNAKTEELFKLIQINRVTLTRQEKVIEGLVKRISELEEANHRVKEEAQLKEAEELYKYYLDEKL